MAKEPKRVTVDGKAFVLEYQGENLKIDEIQIEGGIVKSRNTIYGPELPAIVLGQWERDLRHKRLVGEAL